MQGDSSRCEELASGITLQLCAGGAATMQGDWQTLEDHPDHARQSPWLTLFARPP